MDTFMLQLFMTVSLLGGVCHCWEVKVPQTVTGIKKSCVLVPCSTDPYSNVSWYKYQRSGYPHVYSSVQSDIIYQFKGRTSVPGSAQGGNCSLRIDNLQNQDGEVLLYVWVWKPGGEDKGFYHQTTKINLSFRYSFTGSKRLKPCSSMTMPLCTKPLSSMKTCCVLVGGEELECPAQSSDSDSTPLNNFGMNWNTDCTPDLLTRLEPQKPNIYVDNKQVEGEALTAKCTFRTSCPEPPPQLSWLGLHSPSYVVKHTQNRDTLWDTEVTTTFQVTRRDQGTHLSCRTTLGGQSFQSNSVELDVLYAPTVKVDYTGSRTVVEGHKVSLKCASDSKPETTSYEWVVTRNNTTTHFNESTAVLQDVKRDTSVICIATNSVGQGESKRLMLDVHYPPSILPGAFCSLENGPLKCMCQADAKPNAVISWSIDGSNALFPPFNTRTWDNGSVTVSELTGPWDQLGEVNCTATNLAGTKFTQMHVHSKRTSLLTMTAGAGAAGVCVIIGLVAAIVICKKRSRVVKPVDLDSFQPVSLDKKSPDYGSDEDLYVNTLQAKQACKDQDSSIYQNYHN